jgi:hypothetical protein
MRKPKEKVPKVSHRVFSVRTDIPPAVVLCALPGASAKKRIIAHLRGDKRRKEKWQSKA